MRNCADRPACRAGLKAGHAGLPIGKFLGWQPYQADITEDLAENRESTLEVVLTRRNTSGPLHQVPLKVGGYGPPNWVTEGNGWPQNYMLYPSGLLQVPEIVFATKERQS